MHTPLTNNQGLLMLCLFARPEAFPDDIANSIWPRPWRRPVEWRVCIRGLVWNVKAKLEPYDHTIKSRTGFGYTLLSTGPSEEAFTLGNFNSG